MAREKNIIEFLREEETPEGKIRYFSWYNKEYSIVNTHCYVDDAKILLKAILQQAINDYIKLDNTVLTNDEDMINLETARGLLFEEDYRIDYGGIELGIRDIILLLTGSEPNMTLFREGIDKLYDSKRETRTNRLGRFTEEGEEDPSD